MRAHPSISTTAVVVGLAFLALLGANRYTVRPGDTLAKIAAAHDTTVAQLASTNGLSDPNRIYVGQQLDVGASTPGAPTSAAYTVRGGDTLLAIAARHDTTSAQLVALNALKNPGLIRIGQVLQVPAATNGASATTPTQPTAGGATTHVVRAGETISSIATRYGISQQQVVTANGLTGARIYVGQQLRLVPSAGTGGGEGAAGTHTVRAGDTLSLIAEEHGTTIRALQDLNAISNPNTVRVGLTLKLPNAGSGSSITCPVQDRSQFVNDWGFPRSGGRFHEGNDLFAPRGTPVVATVAGTAAQASSRPGGNQVKLMGDDGTSYSYSHLDGFGATGRVAAGTVIGYVGDTGNAAGSATHLHFEVHPGGGPAVNPYPQIAAAC